MFGVGPAELILLALIVGGTAPLGIPPLPPDAAIVQAAPEKCLLYFASAGTGSPDKASANHTDQLLAAPEVLTFLSQCVQQFNGALAQYGQKNAQFQPFITAGKPLIETLLSRPAAAYVDRIEAAAGGPPDVTAGLIVNCGPRKADVAGAIAAIEKMSLEQKGAADAIRDETVAGLTLRQATFGPGIEVRWGFKDDYFLVTVGKKAAAELLARWGGKAAKPAWMAALERQTGIKRVSTIRLSRCVSIDLYRRAPDSVWQVQFAGDSGCRRTVRGEHDRRHVRVQLARNIEPHDCQFRWQARRDTGVAGR